MSIVKSTKVSKATRDSKCTDDIHEFARDNAMYTMMKRELEEMLSSKYELTHHKIEHIRKLRGQMDVFRKRLGKFEKLHRTVASLRTVSFKSKGDNRCYICNASDMVTALNNTYKLTTNTRVSYCKSCFNHEMQYRIQLMNLTDHKCETIEKINRNKIMNMSTSLSEILELHQVLAPISNDSQPTNDATLPESIE
jgi:hypothetical protein